MQKPPRFGEKISHFDQDRENHSFELYKDYITKPYSKKSPSTCEDLSNFSVFNVVQDKQGLHNSFGLKTPTMHYLSSEEAFFLSTRKMLNIDPLEILKNTHVFIQKILIYSFFKRKCSHIKPKDTSLPSMMSQYLSLTPNKLQNGKELNIKSPDDLVLLEKGEVYIGVEGNFEKLKVEEWDFK